ncbi:MAG: glycerate kinase, partial [Lentisphaerae bacterium]|nr:glycerate kinase [Lentisphaerota bacterium]
MRVLIAPNSFKHCLGALEAGRAMERGVRRALPRAAIRLIPLADGGDGLVSVLRRQLRGRLRRALVTDPLGRPIEAHWLKVGGMAVIELAEASGLRRLSGPREYAPGRTTTAGTGLLVRKALEQGCTTIVIGLGGSATVDAGCGLAAALGFRFLDRKGRVIPGGGGSLHRLYRIDASKTDPRLRRARFIGLCDVKNSLLGPEGAARVFGPQKGATPREVAVLERNLRHWARVVRAGLGRDVRALAGGAAAGWVGAGLA